jgi:hypothetical protein
VLIACTNRTGETDVLAAMASLIRSLPRVRLLIATLGSQGSLLMRRPHAHVTVDEAAESSVEDDEEEGKGEVKNMDELWKRVPKYEDIEAKWQRMWAFGNAPDIDSSSSDGGDASDVSLGSEREEREADTALGLLVSTFCYRPTPADVHSQVHFCPAYPLNPASIVDTTGSLPSSPWLICCLIVDDCYQARVTCSWAACATAWCEG